MIFMVWGTGDLLGRGYGGRREGWGGLEVVEDFVDAIGGFIRETKIGRPGCSDGVAV